MSKIEEPARAKGANSGGKRRLLILLPLLVVVALFGLFFVSLQTGDPQKLPSAMIGRSVPTFDLAAVPQDAATGGAAFPTFGSAELAKGEPSLVNVWASWCAPCIIEHPLLMELAAGGDIAIYGINYKDKPEAARRFISKLGNPYRAIGRDETGRTAIDLGVYGVPETFVIDGKGRIVLRHPGPLTAEVIAKDIRPALERARSQSAGS
jgi:cytochrome c biogenesis protein CcmG/thiol:disulfide interchange protein DsbE